MFKLNLKSEPYWIDMPKGVRLHVLPAGATLMEGVRKALFSGVVDEDDVKDRAETISKVDWAKAMARHAVIAWDGVGDEKGKEIEPTPDYLDALIEDDTMFQAFMAAYVVPAWQIGEEGNG